MSVLVIGISIGMLLFLLAVGLTLIFGMLGVINFAHGALYMLGAYLAYQTVQWTGSFWIALLVSPLIVAALASGDPKRQRAPQSRARHDQTGCYVPTIHRASCQHPVVRCKARARG